MPGAGIGVHPRGSGNQRVGVAVFHVELNGSGSKPLGHVGAPISRKTRRKLFWSSSAFTIGLPAAMMSDGSRTPSQPSKWRSYKLWVSRGFELQDIHDREISHRRRTS